MRSDYHTQPTAHLVTRLEELEDLTVELKTANSAHLLIDLRQVVQSQAVELSDLITQLRNLSKNRVKASDLFERNELFDSFQKVIRDRDEKIAELVLKFKTAQYTHVAELEDGRLSEPKSAIQLEKESERFNNAL